MSFLYVKVYYGPSDTFNTLIHKPQLLTGMKDHLQKCGFKVDLEPVDVINYCVLEMCGHEVFRCNIKNLKFNTSYNKDPICQRAVEAVMTSAVKFRRARAYPWFWTLLDHQMFRRSKYAPVDYWPSDHDLNPLATCEKCVNCCNILVAKRKADDDKVDVVYHSSNPLL